VDAGPGRLLVVGLATGGAAPVAASVTWAGTALTHITTSLGTSGRDGCRAEVWILMAPTPGNQPLEVTLSTKGAFGVGAAVYTGVDPTTPTGPPLSAQGADSPVTLASAGGSGPLFAAACLGGSWAGGSGAPVAMSGDPGQDVLWDFTEPGVVGLGMDHLGAPDALRWNITSGGSAYGWAAAGFILQAAAPALPPDAAAPDAAPPPDTAAVPDRPISPDVVRDVAADAAPEAGNPDDDAGGRDANDDAAAADLGRDMDSVSDGARAPPGDAAAHARAVHLQVGCGCGLAAPSHPLAGTWLLVLAVALLRRTFRPRVRR
jgi:hypothetical protein